MLVHFGGGQLDLQGEGGKFHLHPDKDIYELVSHRGLGASWRFDLEDEHHPKRAVELGQNHEIVRALGQLTSYLEKVNRRDFEGARRYIPPVSPLELDPGNFAVAQQQWLPPDPTQWTLEKWEKDRIVFGMRDFSTGPNRSEATVELTRGTGIWLVSHWKSL